MSKSVIFLVVICSGIIFLSFISIRESIFRSIETIKTTQHEETSVQIDSQNHTVECEAAQGIVFVKTHKTGGTSVKRLLTHYIQNRKLGNSSETVGGIPIPFYGGYPGHFRSQFASMVGSPLLAEYNSGRSSQSIPRMRLLIGHLRFDKDELFSIMRKDVKYITIIRNPIRQFESSFYFYYGLYKKYTQGQIKIACKGEPYFQILKKFGVEYADYINTVTDGLSKDTAWYFRSTNYQSYDLGLDSDNQTEEYVINKAKELDSVFDLVMLTDYYLESLLLLKEVLCMEWEELIGRYRNKGRYEPHVYTKEEERIVRYLNKQDILLYDYFNNTFWTKVEKYGFERMKNDKKRLQEMIRKFEDERTVAKSRSKRITKNTVHNTFLSSTNNNENYISLLNERIQERTSKQLNGDMVKAMAYYMYDNAGWCPQ
ncbi:galactose-3-O-sulfotransferase 3-like [Styela clava]